MQRDRRDRDDSRDVAGTDASRALAALRRSLATGALEGLGSTPQAESERVASISAHAIFPVLVAVGVVRGGFGTAGASGAGQILEGAFYGVLGWPTLAPVVAAAMWLLSRGRPHARFHAGQVFVVSLVLALLMLALPGSLVALGLAPAAVGTALGVYGFYALASGRGFRLPVVGYLVGRRVG